MKKISKEMRAKIRQSCFTAAKKYLRTGSSDDLNIIIDRCNEILKRQQRRHIRILDYRDEEYEKGNSEFSREYLSKFMGIKDSHIMLYKSVRLCKEHTELIRKSLAYEIKNNNHRPASLKRKSQNGDPQISCIIPFGIAASMASIGFQGLFMPEANLGIHLLSTLIGCASGFFIGRTLDIEINRQETDRISKHHENIINNIVGMLPSPK